MQQHCLLLITILCIACLVSFTPTAVHAANDRQTGNSIGSASRPYGNANGRIPVPFTSTIGNQQQLSGIGANAFVPYGYANVRPNNYGGRYGSSIYELNGYLSKGYYWPNGAYYGPQLPYISKSGMIAASPHGIGPYGIQQYTTLRGNRGLQVNPEPRLLPRINIHTYSNKKPRR